MIAAKIDADVVVGFIILAITPWAIVAYLTWLRRLAKSQGRSPWLVCLVAFVCPPAIWFLVKPSTKDLSPWVKSLARNQDDPPESN
jgi:hypothetical protein